MSSTDGTKRPTVLFIAGSGRSGSTLLERTVGAVPGFVNVGELLDVFRRVLITNEVCGCGAPFDRCLFWTAVGERAFGGWWSAGAQELSSLQPQVARHRHLLRMVTARPGSAFAEKLHRYCELYADLYRAVLEVSDASVVVDASKWPAQALALCSDAIDLRVVHLVRDARGVAHSMGKRGVVRPQAAGGPSTVMDSAQPLSAAARWTLVQSELELLGRRGLCSTRVSYEEFVRNPRRAVAAALRALDIDLPDGWDRHIDGTAVDLPPSHGLSGNPTRFASGQVTLVADEAWRREMPLRDRALVTAVALPQLSRTRVLRRRAAISFDQSADLDVASQASETAGDQPAGGDLPLVSVVLPTRGRPELVRDAIRAVVQQRYPGPIECLVVHDQEAADPTLTELGIGDHSVTVLVNSHTPGLAGARNTGLDSARGDLVATCDDDDVWHPDKLAKQVALLRQEPDLLVVGSGIRLLFPGRVVDWPGRSPEIQRETLLRNRVKELHSSTLVMRRDAFAKAGRYSEQLPHGYAEDYDWVLRASRVGRIGVVTEPLADIRKDVPSWFRERASNTAEALEYLLAAHPDIATSRRGHARVLGQIAYARATLGMRREALTTGVRALARYPLAPHAYLALGQAALGLDPGLVLKGARLFRRGLS